MVICHFPLKYKRKSCGNKYSQTCVQRSPLGPGKSGRCSEVVVIQRETDKLFNLKNQLKTEGKVVADTSLNNRDVKPKLD